MKNSESLLKALSANRPSSQSDKSIERFMKISDEWQSYKREIVRNTLVLKGKSSRIVPLNRISKTLNRAITNGSSLRYAQNRRLRPHLHRPVSIVNA